MARVTLQTIADEVGVSRMTVSNAFSRPDQLSEALRERILVAADRLGYAGPDPSARALARGRTGVIGMMLTTSPRDAFADDVAVGFVRAVAGTLSDAGYSLVLLNSSAQADFFPTRDVAMDGVIIYSCAPSSAETRALLERQLPLVAVENEPVGDAPLVRIDDEAGSFEAARHLIELGHTDIAIVTTGLDSDNERVLPDLADMKTLTTRNRMKGWARALRQAQITPTVVGTASTDIDDAFRSRIGRLLDEPPTAILVYSDLAAFDVIEQARARGLRVPQDVSVVGFDDTPLAARVSPALTTVHQDVEVKGIFAAQALLTLLRGDQAADEVVPTSLVVRESTAPPRA